MNYKGHSDTEVIANRIPSGNNNKCKISKNLIWKILLEITCFNQRTERWTTYKFDGESPIGAASS